MGTTSFPPAPATFLALLRSLRWWVSKAAQSLRFLAIVSGDPGAPSMGYFGDRNALTKNCSPPFSANVHSQLAPFAIRKSSSRR